jgi:hypothetical protein
VAPSWWVEENSVVGKSHWILCDFEVEYSAANMISVDLGELEWRSSTAPFCFPISPRCLSRSELMSVKIMDSFPNSHVCSIMSTSSCTLNIRLQESRKEHHQGQVSQNARFAFIFVAVSTTHIKSSRCAILTASLEVVCHLRASKSCQASLLSDPWGVPVAAMNACNVTYTNNRVLFYAAIASGVHCILCLKTTCVHDPSWKPPLYTRGYMSRYLCIHMHCVLNICLM